MNTKSINFRTKTHTKNKSMTISEQFTKIQKVLTQYEKKKFHPKIQNFKYMSTQSIGNNGQKRKFLLKKDTQSLCSQKIFGPLPKVFRYSDIKKTQRSYDISQITFASSQQKEAYTKMSKLRNPERRKRLNQAYPKYSERYIQKVNKNLMEMLGKQVDHINLNLSKEMFEDDERQFVEFQKQRNLIETKIEIKRDSACKKYSEIELDEFLEENTNLTKSQKRRITEYKKRDEQLKDEGQSSSCKKRLARNVKKQKCLIVINDSCELTHKQELQSPVEFETNDLQEQGIRFSSEGWIIAQNSDLNLMTL